VKTEEVTWGDASPAMLFAIGMTLLPLGLFDAGLIPLEAEPIMAAWFLGLMVIDIVGSIICFRRGDTLFGCLGLFFGGMLAGAGAFSSLTHTWWLLSGQAGSIALQYEGWAWFGAGIVLLLFVPATARLSWLLVLFCLEVGIALILHGLVLVSDMAWTTMLVVDGWMIFAFAIYCFYDGLAILTNTIYEKQVMPLGGPLIKIKKEVAKM